MSNHLAVATVTKAFAQLLDSAVKSAVDSASAVTQRPAPGAQTACVDLFLYQVTPNAALRNSDLPTRNSPGQVVTRPSSALDLHYLLSFYGDDSKFEPQRMLGAVVRALSAEPGLTRDRILSVSKDDNGDKMSGSNLADALEQVKFSLQSLSIDELSRIWSIFYQVPYALSLGYVATVVTIESEETVLAAQPVLKRGRTDQGVETQLGPFPSLETWHIGEDPDDVARLKLPSYPAARLGTILTLRGKDLGGEGPIIRFNNPHFPDNPIEIAPALAGNRTNELKVIIPSLNPAAPNTWVAGIHLVSVVISAGGMTRSTNSLPLPFAPQLSSLASSARDGDGNVVVTVVAAPVVRATQTVFLALPDREVASSARVHDTDPVEFPISNPVAGTLVARLRVDGVDSMQFKAQGVPPRPVIDRQTVTFPA